MTPAERRDIARLLVQMRRLLIASVVAELFEDKLKHRHCLDAMDDLWSIVPLPLKIRGGLERRVGAPVRRKLDRETLLGQKGYQAYMTE